MRQLPTALIDRPQRLEPGEEPRLHLSSSVELGLRHCQTNLNEPARGAGLKRSSRQLTRFGESGSAVLLEDVAAVEVTVVVEVVVD